MPPSCPTARSRSEVLCAEHLNRLDLGRRIQRTVAAARLAPFTKGLVIDTAAEDELDDLFHLAGIQGVSKKHPDPWWHRSLPGPPLTT